MHSCSPDNYPTFPAIKECLITGEMFEDELRTLLNKLPKTLQELTIFLTGFVLSMLPSLPNLTTLEIDKSTWVSVDFSEPILQLRCPNLCTLILNCDVLSLAGLRGIKLGRLVIITRYQIDVSPLSDAFIEELDLTECPNVIGLSKFPNVKTIKT
jgi:hypothetical protein